LKFHPRARARVNRGTTRLFRRHPSKLHRTRGATTIMQETATMMQRSDNDDAPRQCAVPGRRPRRPFESNRADNPRKATWRGPCDAAVRRRSSSLLGSTSPCRPSRRLADRPLASAAAAGLRAPSRVRAGGPRLAVSGRTASGDEVRELGRTRAAVSDPCAHTWAAGPLFIDRILATRPGQRSTKPTSISNRQVRPTGRPYDHGPTGNLCQEKRR
jgi:hypothetical protein